MKKFLASVLLLAVSCCFVGCEQHGPSKKDGSKGRSSRRSVVSQQTEQMPVQEQNQEELEQK